MFLPGRLCHDGTVPEASPAHCGGTQRPDESSGLLLFPLLHDHEKVLLIIGWARHLHGAFSRRGLLAAVTTARCFDLQHSFTIIWEGFAYGTPFDAIMKGTAWS